MLARIRRLIHRCRVQLEGILVGLPAERRERLISSSAAMPFAGLHRASREARTLVEEQFSRTRTLEDRLAEIDGQIALAWQELTRQAHDHHNLLQGLLEVLDDCQALRSRYPELDVLQERLQRILQDQGVEPLLACPGDPFRSEEHICEATEVVADSPPNVLRSVLRTGYRRRLSQESAVIIRPARVVVTANPLDPGVAHS